MKQPTQHAKPEGSAVVTLHEQGLIICRLAGFINGATVKDSMRQTKIFAEKVYATGAQPRLLIDISKVTGQNSAARLEAKGLRKLGLERVAVSGGKRAIVMVGRYIARASGMNDYTRFFYSEAKARRWLFANEIISLPNKQVLRRAIALVLAAILPIAAIVGWQLDSAVLKSIVPEFKPMNPTTAFILITVTLAAATVLSGAHVRRQLTFLRFTGCLSLLFGLGVLSRFLFSVDLHVDDWLLADAVSEQLGRATVGVGLGFAWLGIMILTLTSTMRANWQRYLFHGVAFAIIVGSLFSVVGYGFGFVRNTLFDNLLSAPLNTALSSILITLVLAGAAKPIPFSSYVYSKLQAYWQAVAVCVVLLFATGIIWQQVITNNDTTVAQSYQETFSKAENAVQNRLTTYIDALDGYRGLFAASTDVNPTEFQRYFESSGLATNYPGFSAFTYVAAVPENSKRQFTQQARSLVTAEYPLYRTFTMFPDNTNAMHYPIFYVQPTQPTTRYGYDLSTEAVRRTSLEQARDSGKPIASKIINLNESRPQLPVNNGFFICLPIYKTKTPITLEGRRAENKGFVIAYFQNDRLFGDLFKSLGSNDVRFTIIDTSTGQQLYRSHAPHVTSERSAHASQFIAVGDQQWRLDMSVADSYGQNKTNKLLELSVLISGFTVALLASLVVLGQLRRRDQALQLAGDMTKDLHAERNKAIANEQKDEAILNSIGDAVFAIDTHERITLFNPVAQKMTGYNEAEALGKHYADILPFMLENSKKPSADFIRQALKGHATSMKARTLLIRRDGSTLSVADSAAPIRDAKGAILGAIVVFRDVTKEHALEQAKSDFVSLASHQLRTPLSAINWYSEMLLGGDAGKLSKAQQEYLQEIFDGNKRMIELVDALLNVSRIEVGKLKNDSQPTDMALLNASLLKEMQGLIQERQVTVESHIPHSLPTVTADPRFLRIILQNIINNAVKYTPKKGKITITMRPAKGEDIAAANVHAHKNYLFISISDTGFGIPKAQQHKVFEKLFRADNVRTLDVEGTGLGLYIVKKLCNMLGGNVWFYSMESVGTTFYVAIPFETKPS